MELSSQHWEQLAKALLSAFPTREELEIMLKYKCNKNLNEITLGNSLSTIVFNVIRDAQAGGWTSQLVVGARESKPGNPKLLLFAEKFQLAPTILPYPNLEKIIRTKHAFQNIEVWRAQMGIIERQICYIKNLGTGFLVGSDLVLTNYHVMEDVIDGEMQPQDVSLVFDYYVLPDGSTFPGVEYQLAEEWYIDSSPPAPEEKFGRAEEVIPSSDQLDYCLLRVNGTPGSTSIGKNESGSPHRGWIKLPSQKYQYEANELLIILQHPRGEPLKFDINTFIGINENETRITYRTNTQIGSSGSPGFNLKWEPVVLHHGPGSDHNRGIPLAAIYTLLDKRGKLDQS